MAFVARRLRDNRPAIYNLSHIYRLVGGALVIGSSNIGKKSDGRRKRKKIVPEASRRIPVKVDWGILKQPPIQSLHNQRR
jgi:hypothetical protein